MAVLNTAVIYGSARKSRQGIKAARFMVRQLEDRDHNVTLVDSQEFELPLLDKMFKEYETGQAPEAMRKLSGILSAADGFIIVSAEYNHSIPAALKNLLDHYQCSNTAERPGRISDDSAGFVVVLGLVVIQQVF